ncbi:MAG: RNA-binding S4 domain-containing protein [Minwuia sp.]|uniref:RNA-binding S4 domain-containing protein n=1 Tax=Minwuia sp. TaxID=2493630 RepID=UPI003A87C415
MTASAIRLDLWLWYARFYKSRSLAAKAVRDSRFRINRRIVSKPSQQVKPGDILTFPRANEVCIVEVVQTGERRGPAAEARALYKDLETAAASG